jgi:uncharacterized protein (UPF0261 family)
MNEHAAIAVLGTFDTKGEEHLFLKERIEKRGLRALTIHVGTREPAPFAVDWDLYAQVIKGTKGGVKDRDHAIQAVLGRAKELVPQLQQEGTVSGIISAGGGTGTHLGTSVMRALPLGFPKVMVSTVASRDMAVIVGTKDITMIHSVVDLLGINRISGTILDKAAGAVCGMVQGDWRPEASKRCLALTFFGFITRAAENTKSALEGMGYEVIPFHANGTGGTAMEEMAAEGVFDGILDLATHELADNLMDGYCGGIGSNRLEPVRGRRIPRLVVPGGLDCAVLEFTRNNIPERFRDRKIFFYDFRSAIRLNLEESFFIADQLADKLNQADSHAKLLVPIQGWSEADREGGPLHEPKTNEALIQRLKGRLDPRIEVLEVGHHINDDEFAELAAAQMDEMVKSSA